MNLTSSGRCKFLHSAYPSSPVHARGLLKATEAEFFIIMIYALLKHSG